MGLWQNWPNSQEMCATLPVSQLELEKMALHVPLREFLTLIGRQIWPPGDGAWPMLTLKGLGQPIMRRKMEMTLCGPNIFPQIC